LLVLVFFFQAEDGIRDRNVTGVQTCALPISTDSVRFTLADHSSPASLVGNAGSGLGDAGSGLGDAGSGRNRIPPARRFLFSSATPGLTSTVGSGQHLRRSPSCDQSLSPASTRSSSVSSSTDSP